MKDAIDKVIDTLLEQDNQVKTLVAGRGQKFYDEEVKSGYGGWDSVEAMADDFGVSSDDLLGFWMITDSPGPSVEELLDKGSPEEIEVHSMIRNRLFSKKVNAYVFDNVAYIIPEDPETGEPIDLDYFF